jgi:nitrate reductase (cytochrome), electron transfer subunit
MSSGDRHPTALLLRFYLIASAGIAIVALNAVVKRLSAGRVRQTAPVAVAMVAAPDEPIRAEAQVFRTTPGMLAIEPAAHRERSAHPRTFATYRFLRAFPGAPPRIPHALTPQEFRTDACRTCHERGGYSFRFAAYVPVTPHPERGICLQCHVGEDSLMGVPVPVANPNARCPQCHGPKGGPPRADATLTWPTSVWPQLPPKTPDRAPPPIPHDLQFRENCLACHSGPAAVAEIHTAHPERANCRQCHVALDPEAGPFTRPAPDRAAGATGAP